MRKPLDALLPRTRQAILAALLIRPEKAWYMSELARWLDVPPSSLQRELRELTEAGILKSHRQGRMTYFQANVGSPIFPELRGLLRKTAGLVDVLADALAPLAEKLRVAFVYGSVAGGTEQEDSDIDVLLVGTATPAELALPLRQAGEQLGREVNPKVYTPMEFVEKQATQDHFLTRVLGKPQLFVIGSSDELGQIAGGQQLG